MLKDEEKHVQFNLWNGNHIELELESNGELRILILNPGAGDGSSVFSLTLDQQEALRDWLEKIWEENLDQKPSA